MKLLKIEIGLSSAPFTESGTTVHVMICNQGNWSQQRFSQCYGSIGIFQIKLSNFTPYQHQNFRPVKPSAFGQVKNIAYLKENSENYSCKAALITGQMYIIKPIKFK